MIKPAQNFSMGPLQRNNSKPKTYNQISAFYNSSNSHVLMNRQNSLDVLTYKDGSFDSIPYNERKLATVKSADFKKQQDNMSKNKNPGQSQRNSSKNCGKNSGQNWKAKINPEVYYYYQRILKNQKTDFIHLNNTQLSLKAESRKQLNFLEHNHQNLELQKNQYFDIRDKNKNRRLKKELRLNQSPNSEMKLNWQQKEQNHKECIEKMKQQVQKVKNSFQNKLTALQYQNKNLKEELFYLRAAILSKYQTNQVNSQNK